MKLRWVLWIVELSWVLWVYWRHRRRHDDHCGNEVGIVDDDGDDIGVVVLGVSRVPRNDTNLDPPLMMIFTHSGQSCGQRKNHLLIRLQVTTLGNIT